MITRRPVARRRRGRADPGRARDAVRLAAPGPARRRQRQRRLDHARGLRPLWRRASGRASTARSCWRRRCPSGADDGADAPARRARGGAHAGRRGGRARRSSTSAGTRPRSRSSRRARRRTSAPRPGRRACATTCCRAATADTGAQRLRRRRHRDLRRPGDQDREPPARLHRARRRPVGDPADGGLPLRLGAARLGGLQPALDPRRLRRRRRGVPERAGGVAARRGRRGPDRLVRAAVHVRDSVRAEHGLQRLPPVAHPRGVPPRGRARATAS